MAIFDPKIFDLRIFDTPVAGKRKRRHRVEHEDEIYWVDSAQDALDLIIELKEQDRKQKKQNVIKRTTEAQFNKELKRLILRQIKKQKVQKIVDDELEFIELMMIL